MLTKPLIRLLLPPGQKGITESFTSEFSAPLLENVFGMLTKPLIRLLLPPGQKGITENFTSDFSAPLLENVPGFEAEGGGQNRNLFRPSSIRMLLSKSTHTVHCYWWKFDDACMRPVFEGRGFVPFVPGSPTEHSFHG
ncbi:uncharacterized protein A4U43_C07F15850 [Asparagus officinalis]|uniref:Uncharacterized protein n=1 Tax=Asparagus officinalis TaxID=4686 RepID=A0A5P1EF82_ASPOF|nr:uncharacterized protein A4U43_C07F15850 [Asparagus officinalis]